jgi:uncharacterized protein
MILDGHLHLGSWTDAWYPGLAVDWAALDRELVLAHIDGAVVTSTDRRDHAELLHPPAGLKGRYWLFPWIDPADPADLPMLEREADRISGLKIHPSANKVAVNDPRWHPYLELAERRGWAILLHCGRWQEMSSYLQGLDAAAKFPGVPFLLAHMGGDTPPLASAAQDAIAVGGYRNVWLGLEGMREWFYVARGIERLGVERFIFGSDYPVGHPRMYLGLVDALGLSEAERALYLGGNLLNVLEGRWKRQG